MIPRPRALARLELIELDLLVMHRGKRYGFEFKRADAPALSRSARSAMADLHLDHLWVVYPGAERYELAAAAEALPLGLLPPVLIALR